MNTEASGKSAREMIREMFLFNPNLSLTLEELTERTGKTAVNIRTAISDLKNPKYAGPLGTLILSRNRLTGKYSLKETSSVSQEDRRNSKENKLIDEFNRIKKEHNKAIKSTAARVVLGQSVIRVFASGTNKDLFPVLVDIPVEQMVNLKDQDEYQEWFEFHLEVLAQAMKKKNSNKANINPGLKWGHSAKILNLYLRDIVSSSRFFPDNVVERVRGWLFVPIDSIVIARFNELGYKLPFSSIKGIKSRKEFYFVQDVLQEAAIVVGVPKVWFDDNWGDRQ